MSGLVAHPGFEAGVIPRSPQRLRSMWADAGVWAAAGDEEPSNVRRQDVGRDSSQIDVCQ